MSEKKQGTVYGMQLRMLSRYGDGLHHKHDKNHLHYRKGYKPDSIHLVNGLDEMTEESTNRSADVLRESKIRKTRKRLGKGKFH